MKHPTALCLGSLLIASCLTQSLNAAPLVAFDSFNTGNTFNTSGGWGIAGASTGPGYRGQAQSFVSAFSGNLATIDLAIGRNSGSGRNNFGIAQDSSGIPGALLESFQNVASAGNFGSAYPPLTLTSALRPSLQSGQTYWIIAEPADATTFSAWNYNTKGFTGHTALERTPSDWQAFTGSADGVFRVSVTPVPEPSTAALLVIGLLAATVACRNSKRS
jgi:PEP-CTERM motif